MNFVFWQNIISLHQSAFLSALSKTHKVLLVAEKEQTAYRLKDGWTRPNMGDTEIIVSPTDEDICRILDEHKDAVHAFSGIDAFPMVFKAFKIATSRRMKVINLLEPYEWEGLKGFLRRVKYTYLQMRFGKRMDAILATGQLGVDSYIKAGFPEEKLFQWGYFTDVSSVVPGSFSADAMKAAEPSARFKVQGKNDSQSSSAINHSCASLRKTEESRLSTPSLSGEGRGEASKLSSLQGGDGGRLPRVLFVGRLDANKNSLLLIETMKPLMDKVECLTIVGDGVLRNEVENLSKSLGFIVYGLGEVQKPSSLQGGDGGRLVLVGNIPNNEVHEMMRNHDILVLPSNYDGWGAVINEALQNGMRVVVSQNCGGNVLVDGNTRGEVFYFEEGERSLKSVLERWIAKGSLSEEEREDIMLWAEKNISGTAVANYFVEITDYLYNKVGTRPVAPWMR